MRAGVDQTSARIMSAIEGSVTPFLLGVEMAALALSTNDFVESECDRADPYQQAYSRCDVDRRDCDDETYEQSHYGTGYGTPIRWLFGLLTHGECSFCASAGSARPQA